jgi:hypothetical protein
LLDSFWEISQLCGMTALIQLIDDYCFKTGMKPSTLGFHAVGDGKFVARLRQGGRCWPETEAKVRAYIEANPAPEKHAAA